MIITATGLNLLPLGGIGLSLDGAPVRVPQRVAYKGMMLEGVPNMAFAIGYTNASWTLKVDLVAGYVVRTLRQMRDRGYAVVTPRVSGAMTKSPFIDMSSGYFERSRDTLPLQGDRVPWRLRQHSLQGRAVVPRPGGPEGTGLPAGARTGRRDARHGHLRPVAAHARTERLPMTRIVDHGTWQLASADETLHEPGPELLWNESYSRRASPRPTGRSAVTIQLGLYPNWERA